jgi:hypothetical protein
MNLWLFLLAPITVLAILSAFGVIGCAAILSVDDVSYKTTPDNKPDYPGTIKDQKDKLVAYWRLVESGSEGAEAKDETGSHSGNYHVFTAALNGDQPHHSPKTKGIITPGQSGLVASSPSTCNHFDGGYVQVGFSDKLNLSPFSLECWVFPDDITGEAPGNYYCLFESTGPAGKTDLGPKSGFGLYIGPRDPKTTTGPFYWQVWMGDSKTKSFVQKAVVSDTSNTVHFNALTYLLLTFDGTNVQLFLYYPGTNQNCDLKSILALQASVQNFQPNDATVIGGGPFFIGAGSNLFPAASKAPPRLYPFKGKIQEVAFYNVDMSAPDVLPKLLMSHIGCSGTM